MSAWIVFSNNKKIGSKLISYGSAKNADYDLIASHFSYCFKETYVLESRLTSGVRADEWENFKSHNNIIAAFDVTDLVISKYEKWYYYYKALYKKIMGKKYDKTALIYLASRIFLWKFFNIPIPSINPKNRADKYFCVEVFSDLIDNDLSMTTPHQLMIDCEKRFKRVI